jgi:hypothetical protein
MRRLLVIGGIVSGAVLIAFGIGSLVLAVQGKSTVTDSLKQEKIVGSPDMTPDAIAAAAEEAGLTGIDFPDCSVANEEIDTGSEARCFADYMRIHALEASGGKTYAELPRFATEDGKGTADPAQAQKDANGQPVANPVRDLWVTETALATALNTAYMADQLGNFGIVVGIALLLAGAGFIILALGGALRGPESGAATSV